MLATRGFREFSKTDLANLICVSFGKSEVLNIDIFIWYKPCIWHAVVFLWHLDFIKAIGITWWSLQYGVFVRQAAVSSKKLEILSSIPHFYLDKKNKIEDMKFSKIRLFL